MYDELSRIEGIYGCVAEYNRCMWEEENEYEPTEEEIAESKRQLAEYEAKIKRLDGTPSEFIKALVAEWAESEPKYKDWNIDGFYKVREWSKARTLDIVAKVAEHYGVKADEEWASFYEVPEGKFAIKIEYHDSCYIKSLNIGNLDFPTFKDVFRDLHYAKLYPTMSYKGRFISGCSLGTLLYAYIKEV